MRVLPLFFCLLLLHFRAWSNEKPATPSLRFTRNNGQWNREILYRAAIPGGFVFVKQHSLQYVFYDTKALSQQHPHVTPSASVARVASQMPTVPDLINAHGFEVQFKGANLNPVVEAVDAVADRKNFFLGNDPAQWAASVPSFSQVLYQNLYPGIDLKLYAHNGMAKYEFVVAPGANANQIKLEYTGMTSLSLKEGFLVTKTTVNTVTETPPYCFQSTPAGKVEVPSRYVLKGNTLSFDFPEGYQNKAALVIDPYLVFSTYSGSYSDNWGFTATYDEEGNLYSGGIEFGNQFPATNGAFQVKFSGQIDVAVLKYTPDGTQLVYATYLGGGGVDVPHSLIVNKANELVILGTTASTNFPTSANAFDKTFNGGSRVGPLDVYFVRNDTTYVSRGGIDYLNGSDLFVSKIDASGSSLAGSTYLGGTGNDGLNTSNLVNVKNYGDQFRGDVNVDEAGNIYVASTTTSANFPVQNGPQPTISGTQDAILCQLSADLSTLQWSTYFGGDGFESASGLRIGNSGSIYACGGTTSHNLPTQAGVLKPGMTDSEDGFVARFTATNAQPTVSYIGTDDRDQAYLIDLDKDENVYVMGLTFGQYPATTGVYRNPNSGQFIHAMNNSLTQTLFSTTIGSGRQSPDISPTAFMVSDCGFIYLTGWGGIINQQRGVATSSTLGLPVTPDAIRGNTNGDDYYLMILSTNASSLLYGTFFGSPELGNHVDGGTSRFQKDGTIYHAACACRDNSSFPTTPNAWSKINNGSIADKENTPNDGCNNAAFKFALDGLQAGFDGEIDVCAPFQGTYTNTSQGARSQQWEVNGQVVSTGAGPLTYTFTQPGEYTITLRIFNPATCKQTEEVSKKVTVRQSTPTSINPSTEICFGDKTQLRADGGVKYEWLPATGLDDPTSPTPMASPQQTTEYRVKITNVFGCTQELKTKVAVGPDMKPAFDVIISSECGKPNRIQLVNKTESADGFKWVFGDGKTSADQTPGEFNYDQAGEYEIILQAFNNTCSQSISQKVTVEDPKLPPNVITPNGDGKNELFELPNPGWKLEVYDRWGKYVYSSEFYQNDWGNDIRGGIYFYRITSPLGASCKGWLHVLK